MRIIATQQSENSLLEELVDYLQAKGITVSTTNYEDGFGITVWSVNDLDGISATEDWTHNEKIRFMEEYGGKIGGATDDSWAKLASFVESYIADQIKTNNAYVEKHSNEFDSTKFYLDVCGGGWVRMVYFNPDSNAGGQLVDYLLSASIISNVGKKYPTEEKFWSHLYENSKTTLTDIDVHDFMSSAVEFVEEPCDLTEETSETMEKLIHWANSRLSNQGG